MKDILWYSEAGVIPNALVRFDPRTEIALVEVGGGQFVRGLDRGPRPFE